MEFKGTKGEWYTEEYQDNKYNQAAIKINSNGGVESFITVWSGHDEICEQTKSDAQLISCAPEMLEMLIGIADKYDKDGHLLNVSPSKIKELINKATTI